MNLIRYITEEEYKKLINLSKESKLISDNKGNYYHADPQYGNNPLYKDSDVIWINNLLRTIISNFVSFSNFIEKEPNVLRLQYKWSEGFTGVGYVTIEELKNGFKIKDLS